MTTAAMSAALANDLAEIDRLIELVESFGTSADLPPRVVQQTVLALDELITNVVHYGYDDGARGRIEVSLKVEPGRLVVEIVDDGRPFDILDAPPPDLGGSLEQRKVGGLGLHIVRQMMDSVRYDRARDRNHVVLEKRIGET